jgi:hypothetical protein
MKRSIATLAISALLIAGCSRAPSANSTAENEKKFQEMMAGVTLVGHSTSSNREGLSDEERYSITKVSKVAGDTWLIDAHLKYGSHDFSVPIPVTIKWAGDTPVIELTDLTIPGAGTFTARVLLYRDQYSGAWSAKDHGGQLFGKIVHH